MRLATFSHDGQLRLGVLDPATGTLTDLSRAAPDLPGDMNGFIALGTDGLAAAQAAVDNAGDAAKLSLDAVTLHAPNWPPVRDPFAVGRNYHEHAQEFHDSGFDATSGATAVPDHPIIFTKATTSVSGPFDPIPAHLDPSKTTDYEGELAVVIGPGGRGISKANAFDHVYGYTVSNDVTARTLQH
jgi:2-keto-4-pentenoate hydratase/2-oxohepta-3-ene-1,7-dioic acid hydratase in catechol pathway